MNINDKPKAAVIGAGAWGTALAWSLATNGTDTTLWALEPEVAASINDAHENGVYLPGVTLPESLRATSDMAAAVDDRRFIVFVVPSQFMRMTLRSLAKTMPPDAIIISATKGIENETLSLPVEIIDETAPAEVAARSCFLSGPTFAKELVKKVPTAATIASRDDISAKQVQKLLSAPYFRLYVHHDVVGVELGGAVKNVIAIGAGIADGLGFGHNTRAALITRGLMEMARLGEAMGANAKTFTGLTGMGDLVLTCAGDLSRNRTVGLRLGQGEKIQDITGSMKAVAEGVATALSVMRLAEKHVVDMPICAEVYRVLYEGKEPRQAVTDLMSRGLKSEFY